MLQMFWLTNRMNQTALAASQPLPHIFMGKRSGRSLS
jgi:PTS system cellobiose-specific IIC component